MTKRTRILLALLALSRILGGVLGIKHLRNDSVVMKSILDTGRTIQIRARKDWEMTIPVYLDLYNAEGKRLFRSGSFYYYSPKHLDANTLGNGPHIETVDHIMYLYHRDDPHDILAMVSLEETLVYPDSRSQKEVYYSQVDRLFPALKVLLKNDQLTLYR